MQKIALAPFVNCGFRNNGELSLGFGSIQNIIKKESEINAIFKMSAFLKTPQTDSEIEIFLETEDLKKAFSFLKDNPGYLINSDFLSDKNNRYHRQNLFFSLSNPDPVNSQQRLKDSHVVILGCGGIGNNIAVNLATSGIGKLSLIDSDIIEITNLNRQFMFTEEDVGQSKINTLKNALLSRNSELDIAAIDCTIAERSDLYEYLPERDLIVLSADTPGAISFWVNSFCIEKNIPFISVGYVQDIAIVGSCVIPGITGCLACKTLFSESSHQSEDVNDLLKKINTGHQAPSIGPINMIASGLASLEVIKFLSKSSEVLSLNKRIGLWTNNGEIETQNCEQNKECVVCGHLSKN